MIEQATSIYRNVRTSPAKGLEPRTLPAKWAQVVGNSRSPGDASARITLCRILLWSGLVVSVGDLHGTTHHSFGGAADCSHPRSCCGRWRGYRELSAQLVRLYRYVISYRL